MAVAADTTALPIEPSLDEVRELARDHSVVPLRNTFIDDCETPVSAFLKLRGRSPEHPAFLLESAEQGQRVGPLQLHRSAPALGAALVARRRGRSLRTRRRGGRALEPGAAARSAAVLRRPGGLLRLRPRAHRRAARRAEPRRARAAGHGADAERRARHLRPPQAHDHDPRERLRGGRGRPRRRLRGRRGDDREGARTARRARSAARRAARAARSADVRAEHGACGVRGDGRADRRVRPRRRRLPGRPVAALVGGDRRRPVLRLSRAARGQPVAVHVLPRLPGLPDRRRQPRAAADRRRPRRARRGRSPARARAAPTPRRTSRSPRACSRTRRSAPST